jgi:hypothetical protein
MTTLNSPKIPLKSLAKQLARLKSLYRALDKARKTVSRLESEIFSATYFYCKGLVQASKVVRITDAHKALADALQISSGRVSNWYNNGKFMIERNISDDATASSVEILTRAQKKIPRADMLKGINMVKKGANPASVAKMIAQSSLKSGATAEKKTQRLKKAGRLTKTQIKMEAMVILRLATELWGDGVSIEFWQTSRKGVEKLLEVK